MNNLAHAVALASIGWYLMMPPIRGGRPDQSESLTLWERVASFDSAQECEDYKSRVHARMQKRDAASAKDFMSSACIASDDPGLKPR